MFNLTPLWTISTVVHESRAMVLAQALSGQKEDLVPPVRIPVEVANSATVTQDEKGVSASDEAPGTLNRLEAASRVPITTKSDLTLLAVDLAAEGSATEEADSAMATLEVAAQDETVVGT